MPNNQFSSSKSIDVSVNNSQEYEGYFNPRKGGMRKNSLNKESIKILRRKNIPESIIRNMNTGNELSEVEKEILHSKKLEYVSSVKRTSFVRQYIGGTTKRLNNLNLANKIRLK